MKLSAITLAFVLGSGGLTQTWAAAVDHYSFSLIASPERVGAPLTVTVSALDATGGLVTNFAGPVQLFFTNDATPVYFNDFHNGFPFDTDGDGTSDNCEWRSISGSGLNFYGTYDFNLHSNTVYSLSFDQAVIPGGTSQLLFSPDAVLYAGINPSQIGAWGGWFPPNQVSRYFPYVEFNSMGEGAHSLMLRYWLPLGGSTSIYTDNIKVRVRDVSPGMIVFQGGQWTGSLTPFSAGSGLVLRALDNNGRSGESNPFDVLPRAADVSVTLLPADPLAVGAQYASLNFLVSNAGPSSIEGVVVTNEIPADFTLIQTVPYGGSLVDSTHVVTGLPAIAGGSAMTFSLVVERFQAGPAPVTASLSAPDYDTNPDNQFAGGSFLFVPVLSGPDVMVTESAEGTNAVFEFTLNATNSQDLAVNYTVASLSATPGVDYLPLPPGTLLFPAGSTQQSLVVPVLADPFYEANEQFAVTLSLTNGTLLLLDHTNYLCTIVSTNPLPTLTVTLPASAVESVGTLTNAGGFSLSAPFEQDLWLTVSSGNTARVLSPGGILLPAGETSGTFNLSLVDDHTWNAPPTVTLTVACTNGMSGAATLTVLNDDPPALSVTAGFKPAEGNGTVTNGLRVLVPFALGTNLTIALASSDTTEMVVPDTVVLPAGATYVAFSPTVIDDTETDGPQPVAISAAAPGFLNGTLNLTVNDNDLHHFVLRSGQLQGQTMPNQTSQVPFAITVSAQDLNSNLLTGYTQAVALSATSDLGVVQMSPVLTPRLERGSWYGSLTISNGDFTNVRIVATETNGGGHFGQSNPFRVYASPAQQLKILNAQILGPDVQLQFNSVTGRNYRVESTTALTGGVWQVVVPAITGVGGAMSVTNAGGATGPQQFYRMALQP